MSKVYNVICADIKPLHIWFQIFEDNKNYLIDLKKHDNYLLVSNCVDYIHNMACNMDEMDFV